MKNVLKRLAAAIAWVRKPGNVTNAERLALALLALYTSLHKAGVI